MGLFDALATSRRRAAVIFAVTVAAVCVVMLCHDAGVATIMEESTLSQDAPETGLAQVQLPLILASDDDLQRAIARSVSKAQKQEQRIESQKRMEQKKRKEEQQKEAGTWETKRMAALVEKRNHEYAIEQKRKAMAAALGDGDSDSSDDMSLLQTGDFTDELNDALGAFSSKDGLSAAFDDGEQKKSLQVVTKSNKDAFGEASSVMEVVSAPAHPQKKASSTRHRQHKKQSKRVSHSSKQGGRFNSGVRLPGIMEDLVNRRNMATEMEASLKDAEKSSEEDVEQNGVELIQDFSDDLQKELGWSSKVHSVPSNFALLHDDAPKKAPRRHLRIAKKHKAEPKPHKAVKTSAASEEADPFEDLHGPMAKFVAHQRALNAMQSTLRDAAKEAAKTSEEDDLQL